MIEDKQKADREQVAAVLIPFAVSDDLMHTVSFSAPVQAVFRSCAD